MKYQNLIVAVSLLVAGCAIEPDAVSLGPPQYNRGFADGCSSGYVAAGHLYYSFRKNTVLFNHSEQYEQGWNDGFATCKGRYEAIGRL